MQLKSFIRHIYWLISRSLYLDLQFLKVKNILLKDKTIFIAAKYQQLLLNILLPKRLRKMNLFGKDFYYYDEFANSLLQSLYIGNEYLRQYIPPKSTIIDVGANIGQFNFFCRDYLKATKVISFEPIPYIYDILSKNHPKYSYNVAISTKKKLLLGIPDSDIFGSIVPDGKYSQTMEVKPARLEDFPEVNKARKIDLFKIDTEGSELDVLKSSISILKKSHYILIECSISRPNLGGFIDVCQFMKKVLPKVQIIYIGDSYSKDSIMDWVEVLFRNPSFKS